MYLSDVCTIPSNLAGHPAISVPFGTGDDGLPVGVQVLAPALGEAVMFRVAAASRRRALRAPWPPPATWRRRWSRRDDDWETVIGLEVHCELRTATKLFCGCRNAFGDEPNTNVCPVCLGLPGSLPVLNRRAVELRHADRHGPALRGPAVDLPPQELLLSRHAEGLPDQPVRRADQRRRLARAARRHAGSASCGPTWRRTPARRPTSAAAGGSTTPTTRSSTTTGPACRWSRS